MPEWHRAAQFSHLSVSRIPFSLVFIPVKRSRAPDRSTCKSSEGAIPLSVGSRDGEPIADLFKQYHGKLVKSLVARTGSWEEARDIASQAFAEVLAQRSGTVSFLGPYLYRTARNIAINRLAHEAMRQRKTPIVGYNPEEPPSPEPVWAEREQLVVLQRAVEELAPRLRMAFVLRIWDELPYEEIAARFAAMGIKLNIRTLQRYVAQAFDHCREAVLSAEGLCERDGE